MIISQTPFRISFFGGGTDFPEYYANNNAATLSATINQYCYISVHDLSPFFKYRFRASYAKTETVQSPEEFQHPLIRECLLQQNINSNMEISHVADLPGQTGIGSSSSFTVGLLHALHAFKGETVTQMQLANEAIDVERVRVGDAGGHQDQYAAAFGGIIRVDYNSSDGIAVKRISLPSKRLDELSQHLMMFYTGFDHSAQDILTKQTSSIQDNSKTLETMYSMVNQAEDILEGESSMDAFGALLHETWELKKTLSQGISNPEIDKLYESARSSGALGGKLLGAGGRGFLLLYVKADKQADVRQSLNKLQEVPLDFSEKGSRILFHNKD